MSFMLFNLALLTHVAAGACEPWAAKVVSVQGQVERLLSQANKLADNWQPLLVDQVICSGESIRLAEFSRASLYLSNNTFLRLDEKSLVTFPAPKTPQSYWLELKQGIGHFISRIKHRFEVSTPYVNAAVDGTEFVVQVGEKDTKLSVIEGNVTASNPDKQLSLQDGEQLIATRSGIRRQAITVHPRDSVSWALYFPPILSLQELAAINQGQSTQAVLQSAIAKLQSGRPDQAIKDIAAQREVLSAENQAHSTLSVAQAALLLSVGRIDHAGKILNEVVTLDEVETKATNQAQAQAYALKAVISAITSEPDTALSHAEKALQRKPDSSTVLLAYSYADQSAQRLSDARYHADLATQVAPTNPLAWSRLSEIHLIFGDITAADHAIQQALELTQNNPEVLTRAGLVNLMKLNIERGKNLLTKSLAIDSTRPDTRLGLALAYARKGQLEQSRLQMEYATSLNPASSVLRSYLGRLYFTEKREQEAQVQWQLAQEFDPFDPTPHLYEGVQKLFDNNPVGAADSLEKSKELNTHRGVYRSESLLQSDAATRSATLGRVYNELGFDQAVLNEGWEALRTDPSNADGHRLLADRYARLSRHETASVSELLQAQLLQPLSAYPLQPQLSERGLAIVEGLGPERPGLNEYHSLFTQDGFYGLVNGLYASDDTWGEDAVVSALFGPVAFSLGQYHFETDGFRTNADQDQDIYNGFLQWQLSPATSVQLEIRQFDWDRGDLGFALTQSLSATKRVESDIGTQRIGVKHEFSAYDKVILSAIRQSFEEESERNAGFDTTRRELDELDSNSYELQYIHQSGRLNAQIGAGHYDAKGDFALLTNDISDFADKRSVKSNNTYAYFQYAISQKLLAVAGLGYDSIEFNSRRSIRGGDFASTPVKKNSQWSPKIGVYYQPNNYISVRAAYFRRLKRELGAGQTIEPTHIVGFNQLYDDSPRSDSTSYATALDLIFDDSLRLGMEALYRQVDIPGEDVFGLLDVKPEQQDQRFRFYLYKSFADVASADLAYEYEDLDFEFLGGSANQINRLKTKSLPIGLNLFLGKHYKLRMEANYVKQQVNYNIIGFDGLNPAALPQQNSEELWLANLQFTYQLPRRFGELELGIENLTDRNTEVVDSDVDFVRAYPQRFFYTRLQISF